MNNNEHPPVLPVPPQPAISPLQKLGNAVNIFGMAVANEDHKLISSSKKHLIDVIHAIHPEIHEVASVSPIIKPVAG